MVDTGTPPATAEALARALDGKRFWRDMLDIAAIGSHPDGSIRRLALNAADNDARIWLADQGKALGCETTCDSLGNLYLCRSGTDSSLAPLLVGSHLDSQPRAGAYDGSLGVLAGLAVLRGLHAAGIRHRRPIELVSWTNEEGARFTPGTSGSAWFSGLRSYEQIVEATDAQGVRCADALSTCLEHLKQHGIPLRSELPEPRGFIELHIEQGPVLEGLGVPVGSVSGIQGVHWYNVEVVGRANHAGTTPRSQRADAFDGAHALITAIKQAAYRDGDDVRFTIGRFSVAPGSVNTIPERAEFTIDLRHPNAQTLATINDDLTTLAASSWSGCEVTLSRLSTANPVTFDPSIVEIVTRSAQEFSPGAPTLMSGAFHDAINLSRMCPTAMLFAACRDGISHSPEEHVERDDAIASMRALGMAVAELAELVT